MKVICNARKLTDAFLLAASVAPIRSPKEILRNVKVTASQGELRLSATDCEIAIEVRVTEDVETLKPGTVLLPVGKTSMILRENTDESITIETFDTKAVMTASRSKFQLLTESPDEFPMFDSHIGAAYHELPARSLAAMIHRTVFATDDDSSRYALGGVNIEADQATLIAVGTDGRRLATCSAPATSEGGHLIDQGKVIIPSRASKLIERALSLRQDDLVRITASLNDVVVETDQCIIYSRIVEGRYPSWRQVIPQAKDYSTIQVFNGSFLAAVKQAAIATSQDSQGIDLTFGDGEIKIDAATAEVGEASVTTVASTDMEEGPVTLKADNRFIREFCQVVDLEASVQIQVTNSSSPMMFVTDDGYRYVVMPMARDR
jgi:DNA polymerase-3 subunit beta